MTSVRDALTRAADQLSAHPSLRPTALADAAALLMHLLGLERAGLIAHPERALDRETLGAYQELVSRRLGFEPIQYITGVQEFYGLAFQVTPAVLIPRPETELLVEAVLERARPDARILDIGTGSGAIAIALAHTLPKAQVTAIDLSAAALEVARRNAARHGLEDRIRLVHADLFLPVSPSDSMATFDVIVSNPPYVPASEVLHPQVRDHEPAQALFAGPEGLDVYRRLIPQAHAHLAADGLFALEIGYGQKDAIAELLTDWDEVTFLEDLQQIARVALARSRAGHAWLSA